MDVTSNQISVAIAIILALLALGGYIATMLSHGIRIAKMESLLERKLKDVPKALKHEEAVCLLHDTLCEKLKEDLKTMRNYIEKIEDRINKA